MSDESFIGKALELAEKGRGRVSPNPLVGAVIVKGDRIIGEGYHRVFGAAHAEVEALQNATEPVAGATLYVNLEPCSHFGKQPPCVNRILESGIKRVVVGIEDPNPLVNGQGLEILRRNGVEVRTGVLREACEKLNEAYLKHVVTGLPLTTLKIAQTLDARIATRSGSSKWITSEAARRYVHQLRSRYDAVLVGIGTVLQDDPSLTVRLVSGSNPRRIVVDSRLRIPLSARLLSDSSDGNTIVATTPRAPEEKLKAIEATGADVWVVEADAGGSVHLPSLWKKLGEAGITSVLVEGGSRIFTAVLRDRLVDKLVIFIAPRILGAGLDAFGDLGVEKLEEALRLKDLHVEEIGGDVLVSGTVG